MKTTTPSTIAEFIENLADTNPGQIISSFQDEINIYTVKELNNKASLLAKGLLYNGVGKNTPVGLVMAGTTSCLTFTLALAKIGALLIPINTKLEIRLIKKILQEEQIHTLAFYADAFLNTFQQIVPNLTQNERGYLHSKDLPQLKNIVTLGSVKNRGIFTTRELMLVGSHMDDIEMEDTIVAIKADDVFIHKISFGELLKMKVEAISHGQIVKEHTTFADLQNYLLRSI
ncbi:MAG: AMP-binding protein [Prolixibacteraceae bacterium]